MLLYVVSRRIPLKTFVVMCKPSDTIAKVRANLLHTLYELDKLSHFQLRYNGEYLRDGYSVEDYRLPDNAVVKMIPLMRQQSLSVIAKRKKRVSGDASTTTTSSDESAVSGAFQTEILNTLLQEIRIFDRRERLFTDLNVALYFHWFATLGGFVCSHWYAGFWALALTFFAYYFCPSFSRVSGFVKGRSLGTTPARRKFFLNVLSSACCLDAITSIVFACLNFFQMSKKCGGEECSDTVKYSIFYFSAYAVLLVVTAALSILLTLTIDIEVGDLVEGKLGQERDVVKVLRVAEGGSKRDKRVAAFELATLAAFSEDNKYLIAGEEGGLGTILRLMESDDLETVNYAAETIANLATIQALQDSIVSAKGVDVLTRVLADPATSSKTRSEVLTSLSYIASDTHDFKERVATTEGLRALADVVCGEAEEAVDQPLENVRTVAALLLEMSFLPTIRVAMLRERRVRDALLRLSSSSAIRDADINLTALQCVELLVIEEKEHESNLQGFIGSQESPSDDALPKHLVDNLLLLLDHSRHRNAYSASHNDDDADRVDADDDDDDDAVVLSSGARALVRITIKILTHLMEARGRAVVVVQDLATFTRLTRRLVNGFCARGDPDVNLAFVATLLSHSVVPHSSSSSSSSSSSPSSSPSSSSAECPPECPHVRRVVEVIEEAQRKSLALEDKESWIVFNECKKKLIDKAA